MKIQFCKTKNETKILNESKKEFQTNVSFLAISMIQKGESRSEYQYWDHIW